MNTRKILGKFPRMSKVPLQGNGMAAIPKSKSQASELVLLCHLENAYQMFLFLNTILETKIAHFAVQSYFLWPILAFSKCFLKLNIQNAIIFGILYYTFCFKALWNWPLVIYLNLFGFLQKNSYFNLLSFFLEEYLQKALAKKVKIWSK